MGETEVAVFKYMKSQNRPYSALDVFQNLHKKYGKTAIVKAMESLSEKNKLLEKTYGKSKIYVINQSQFADVNDDELKEIDDKILQLDLSLKDSKSKLAASSSELKSLTLSLTTEDALSLLQNLKSEIQELEKQLAEMKSNCVKIDATEKKQLTEQHKHVVGQWKKRKRMTCDIMNAVLEGYPKTKKQFLDEVGIETDEEHKLVIPST